MYRIKLFCRKCVKKKDVLHEHTRHTIKIEDVKPVFINVTFGYSMFLNIAKWDYSRALYYTKQVN